MVALRISKKRSPPDYAFVAFLLVLLIFGFVMLSSASSDLAQAQFGDSYYYLKHQALYGLSVGLIGFFVGAFVYYRRWEQWATPLLLVSLVLLLLVFTPLGFSAKGGERWLNLRLFTFQPGELIKLTFFIYLAAWVGRNQLRGKSVMKGLLPFMVLVGSVMLLLIMQPATTTAALIFGASLVMYFAAGARLRYIVAFVAIAAGVLAMLVYISPYRLQRVATFLNPNADQLGAGYHINQALLAIGSGGVSGVGFGQSTTKLHYLPEPIGDSIFAVIAEELGFIGSIALVLAFLLFVWRGLRIARASPDSFGRFLVTGFTCMIGLQAFVNIAAISGLIPLTGVPLPFVSYGGTALAVFLTMSGIMVNVSRHRQS